MAAEPPELLALDPPELLVGPWLTPELLALDPPELLLGPWLAPELLLALDPPLELPEELLDADDPELPVPPLPLPPLVELGRIVEPPSSSGAGKSAVPPWGPPIGLPASLQAADALARSARPTIG